ncbi:ParA family protein [Halopiger xanaduensis]|uniref:ATPase involved in chromosome partitioning-like protein n=1 Tax=Halopiger xanaduensis (strain DSM 18323 / JCM 14033 / SH-6) TaxID=797210 RepID=F8DEP7_HALXS|nr:ParA family protein [Halopiger xanaduensis]AEH39484.1 ATPase involved in chromosome partitioning-like protein [Halopiger xanaduensis SH-6]
MSEIKRLATYVQKGGVGKTTSSAHFAVSAAQDHDLDVVLIDLAGTQNDLATHFGLEDEVEDLDAAISAVFGDKWDFIRENIDNVVDRMVFETGEGPDLIPADPGLSGANNNLANVPLDERFQALDDFVSKDLAPRYDLVVMDLPGNENNIVLNGLFAAQHTLAPLSPGQFELNQLKNLEEDLIEITETHDDVNPELTMVVPTTINRGEPEHLAFADEVEDTYPEIVGPRIQKTADIGREQGNGRTVFALEDDELLKTGVRARDAYRELTDDLLPQLEAR